MENNKSNVDELWETVLHELTEDQLSLVNAYIESRDSIIHEANSALAQNEKRLRLAGLQMTIVTGITVLNFILLVLMWLKIIIH